MLTVLYGVSLFSSICYGTLREQKTAFTVKYLGEGEAHSGARPSLVDNIVWAGYVCWFIFSMLDPAAFL